MPQNSAICVSSKLKPLHPLETDKSCYMQTVLAKLKKLAGSWAGAGALGMQTPLAQGRVWELYVSLSPSSIYWEGHWLEAMQGFLMPALCCFIPCWVLVNWKSKIISCFCTLIARLMFSQAGFAALPSHLPSSLAQLSHLRSLLAAPVLQELC